MAPESFRNADAGIVVLEMIAVIRENAKRLSEIDGAIGDGDHGINMGKGFGQCGERIASSPGSLADNLRTLGNVLLTEIGGAMGPLYGTLFLEMANAGNKEELITGEVFGRMLERAAAGVVELGNAKIGDKTMIDALAPAADAYTRSMRAGGSFAVSLSAMAEAAEKGMESTRGMAARVGRASRLGERSRGTLDPGAASCALLLGTMARAMTALLGAG